MPKIDERTIDQVSPEDLLTFNSFDDDDFLLEQEDLKSWAALLYASSDSDAIEEFLHSPFEEKQNDESKNIQNQKRKRLNFFFSSPSIGKNPDVLLAYKLQEEERKQIEPNSGNYRKRLRSSP